MKHIGLLVGLVGAFGTVLGVAASQSADPADRPAVLALYNAGNYQEAYELLRQRLFEERIFAAADVRETLPDELVLAVHCLAQLNRENERDAFLEAVAAKHEADWRVLAAVAGQYVSGNHHGFIISGVFQRGHHRGGTGDYVNAYLRDRARALQLLDAARTLLAARTLASDADKQSAGRFYFQYASIINSDQFGSWRLQALTDLTTLPDYEEGWHHYGNDGRAAPVDANNKAIVYRAPASFSAARNDGERWRWLLGEAESAGEGFLLESLLAQANFWQRQFGVETLAGYGFFGDGGDDADATKDGPYAVHTLGDDETIARLATGIQRFKLEPEFNPIRIYERVLALATQRESSTALIGLAVIHENRRQFPRAAEYWRRVAKTEAAYQARVEQIVGNWGRIEPTTTQPASRGATFDYRYRNGKEVRFSAYRVDVALLLDDMKTYLKSDPKEFDWSRVQLENIGYNIVSENQAKYVGDKVAEWTHALEPLPKHFDRVTTITTPLEQAGAYLVTANMKDGNRCHILLWVDDTIIVRKPLDGQTLYFVADAVSGQPIARANVEFFGYHVDTKDDRAHVKTGQFAEFTDANGLVTVTHGRQGRNHNWLAIARTEKGRLAFLGFDHVWYRSERERRYDAVRVFAISDRPVYRPAQKVQMKFWVARARYDLRGKSEFAGVSFGVVVQSPKNEKLLEQQLVADEFGGIAVDWTLPADATLGVYRMRVVGADARHLGGGDFRVEEYKKPEFEVTVTAPDKPVELGERIEATIAARYYFGSPVTEATVKYKVMRSSTTRRFCPVGAWDWLYGPGYWWFGYDYDWYPGWRSWGCDRIAPWWIGYSPAQPEVVAEGEVPIGSDGQVRVMIDTAVAKAIHGDTDHRYTITAEVVDASRRTIVGIGSVLVAREPFNVYVWLDRGHYRAGDTVRASMSASTPDSQPVEGSGKAQLFKIAYKNGVPEETAVESWPLATNAAGTAQLELTAAAPGQFRLSYSLTATSSGHTREGAIVFLVRGEGFDAADYRFNDLELVQDQREYKPGESVELVVNTEQRASTVLLFVRPANSVYPKPKVLKLSGKSVTETIAITKDDMPNFFVEALTISNGKVHTQMREIVVPPESRVHNVAVLPSAAEYKPGASGEVEVQLTDLNGEPITGDTVICMYDKSVDYIAGGSNVPMMRDVFWKWRRQHHIALAHSAQRSSWAIYGPRDVAMATIGLFGEIDAEESDGDSGRVERRARAAGSKSARGMPAPGSAAKSESLGVAGGFLEAGVLAADAEAPGGEAAGETELVAAEVRKEFADTALWVASLRTDARGIARVPVKLPENLTTWRVRVWSMAEGTRVGQGDAEVVTRKNLLLRLQAPRFFTQNDEVVLSANVHNYLSSQKRVQVALELDGETLEALGARRQTIDIEAGGAARVDWRVKVNKEGEAVVRMLALSDEESDAMEQRFPVHVHGADLLKSISGVLRPAQDAAAFQLEVPEARRVEETVLTVRFSPTLAAAMVDALPYLVDYPYGCTEQTLSRFLPAVLTQKTLLEMGIDLATIREKQANLNAQELGDPAVRAAQWKQWSRNPVFDADELTAMVKEGVRRLTDMQLSDGGWGWFSGFGERSSAHTTAYVVHGLTLALGNDVAIVPGVVEAGRAWLARYQDAQLVLLANAGKPPTVPQKASADNLDAFVHLVLVEGGMPNDAMRGYLYRDRTNLAVYAKAMLGIALDLTQRTEERDMLIRNIAQFEVQDDENQTMYLNLPDGYWWYWYGSEYEAHAYYLKLLSRVEPKGEKAARLVKYLLNNRKHGGRWHSTRDTAICVEAMAEFLRASGEDKPNMTVEVWLDGEKRKTVAITPENLFGIDNQFELRGSAVAGGARRLELRRTGAGPLYYNAYLRTFSLEEHIKREGLELKVNRKAYRLDPVEQTAQVSGDHGQVIEQRVEKFKRVELADGAELASGDLVEIELSIASKNDYEYVIFEDFKGAGFEPVDLRSGYNGNALRAYMELRDRKVCFFVHSLARGEHSVSYRLRAEIPGRFHALPAQGYAMYAPELRGNSDEIVLAIGERKRP
ncbi:MAG: alpha-2-macroglobulin family protein [Planctomycetota bacterium]